MERWQLMKEVAERRKANPDLRLGQTVNYVAWESFPDEVNALCAGPLDPYCDDSRVDAFLAELAGL